MRPVLVVGGSGFVGRAIQNRVLADGLQDDYLFTYRSAAADVAPGLHAVHLDLLDSSSAAQVASFDRAIWVAGNSDHGQGWVDPLGDLDRSAVTLLNLLQHFRGDLTMLSSQAVYFGLSGLIAEDVDHVPAMPYGFAKLAAERYAGWAADAGRLRSLWVHRLMYTYGTGEKGRRLLARCCRAGRTGERVTISGGGRSFLNPLPVDFVARVLMRTGDALRDEPPAFKQVSNLNHPDIWTVADVVAFLDRSAPFEHVLVPEGEDWPVKFHGDVTRLSEYLGLWRLEFPDVETGLNDYCTAIRRSM